MGAAKGPDILILTIGGLVAVAALWWLTQRGPSGFTNWDDIYTKMVSPTLYPAGGGGGILASGPPPAPASAPQANYARGGYY